MRKLFTKYRKATVAALGAATVMATTFLPGDDPRVIVLQALLSLVTGGVVAGVRNVPPPLGPGAQATGNIVRP